MTVIDGDVAPSRAAVLPLVADDLALDFANTESGRGFPSHQNHLRAAGDVADWLAHAGVLAADEAAALGDDAARRPEFGALLLSEALALRASIHAVGAALAHRSAPPESAIAAIAGYHARCLACATLDISEGRGIWRWRVSISPLEAALGPVALAAVRLLTQRDFPRIKQCGGHACGWLFYDVSKNRGRRWCEMEVCGNRAKQRRHADRLKGR